MEVPVGRLKLKDNPRLISAPVVAGPLYACATAVQVVGYLPHANLDLQIDGAIAVGGFDGGMPLPSGAAIPTGGSLGPGQKVRARQRLGGLTSAWSAPATVRDLHDDYPAGPPRPEINPAPVYQCGGRTGVGNLLTGCDVWITVGGAPVGSGSGATPQQGVNVSPAYQLDDSVVAHAKMCSEEAPPSAAQTAQAQPDPLPAPTFEAIHEGTEQLVLNGLADGATFVVSRNGSAIGTYLTWGGRTYVSISPAAVATDHFTATQQLCGGVGPSPPGTATVVPCPQLAAPQVGPVQDGDTIITLTDFVPDARVRVYVNGVKVGDSGGPVIVLTRAVQDGDTIVVRQSVGSCDGRTAQQLTSSCVALPVSGDPEHLNLFPVGTTEYNGGSTTLDGQNFSVKGTVYYPADADGPGTAFNAKRGTLGPVPIVFLAHGNHDPGVPSHLGYDYFQQQLARMGIVACSVYLNETNGVAGSIQNIEERADLIIAGIRQMQSLGGGGDAIFGGRIDFSRVGLMGHSRGGDAVVHVPPRISLPGVTIAAVISLAPTNYFGNGGPRPAGYAFMTILPAADGDVSDNDGAVFYDTATPAPLKSQLYVLNACHNFFNRQWANNDNGGILPTMSRPEHEQVLSAYGCAFYRAHLLGQATGGYLTRRLLPAGVTTANVRLAFAVGGAVTVDDHEDGNGIGINSMGQPTAQSAGLSADEFPFAQGVAGAFNSSFFGRSTGMVARGRSGASSAVNWQSQWT